GSTTGAAGPALTISPPFVAVVASEAAPVVSSIAPGKKTFLDLTLDNQGNVPVGGTATVTIAASTQPSGAAATTLATLPVKVKLKPGKSARYKLRFTVPATLPAESYYLSATVDVAALGDDTAADGVAVSASQLTVT